MKEYEYIYTIYEEKSFSKAAALLYVTQPTLSSAVKKAEEELGIRIFERTVPLTLTKEGEIYIEGIQKILAIEKEMRKKIDDLSNLQSGKIVVSGENFVASFIMPKIIMEFSKVYPNLDVQMIESNSPGLKSELLENKIDLLISHTFDEELYESEDLFSEELILAVPSTFSINERLKPYALSKDVIKDRNKLRVAKAVSLKEFENEQFLLLKAGNDMNERSSYLFHEAEVVPNVRIYLDQLITSYNMASSGLGISFVTDVLVNDVDAKNLIYYRLSGENTTREMRIGYKKNHYLSHAERAFIDTALHVYRQYRRENA